MRLDILLDGDQLMGLIALKWASRGKLKGTALCATVMSNLGLERRLEQSGVALHRASVGDRYVLEEMRRRGYNVGGEQSGHIILADYATTGDGLLAALQVLAIVAETGKRVSELAHVFEPVPQILKNVRYSKGTQSPLEAASVKREIAIAEERLNGRGRLLIRKSGTEPVIRVMAEGDDRSELEHLVGAIVGAIEKAA